ncbi:hypothetical protein GZ78_23505 [Endozoicomonas numazuensis]|uniref:DUF4124 domain-containing protein n=1 Tax=Endozoicomonas numazuensis TaxID=1137799 RepID=A0A081NCM9_9GAMM|nr:hypothetical protein GZ78_23505 [Endozoicomonas numazuensis]
MIISFSSHAKIYSWVDEKGVKHFSSYAKSTDAEEVQLEAPVSQWKKTEIKIIDEGFDLTESERERIRRDVVAVYEFFDKKLYFDIYKTVPVSIKAFGDKQAYVEYIRNHKGISRQSKDNSHNTLGIYLPKFNEIVIYQQKYRERSFSTIKHEVSHAITDTLTPFVPSWLNEGIAENMETIGFEKGGFSIGPHLINYNHMKKHKRESKLLPVKEFLSLTSKEWRKKNIRSGYVMQTQAGELTRMLLSTDTGLNFISRLMHNYKRGDKTIAFYLVDDEYFGGTGMLESKWSLWVNRKQSDSIAL